MRIRSFAAAGAAALFGLGLLTLTGCGGSTNTGGGGPTTPTVTVSASPASITTAQSTTVTVTVSGTSGTPTGSVTLTSGSYSSGAQTLTNGTASITISAGTLAAGPHTLTASYASTSSSYNNASGSGSVTVTSATLLTPTVTVSPNPASITTAQSTTVTVTVSGTGATPTGSITLSSGTYNSGAKTLVNGSVQVTVQGSALATATDTLTAAYTPDAGSSSVYNSASGTGSVTVTAPSLLTPTVTVTPNPSSITTAQSTTVTITVSGTGATPTGSITLSSGTYNSGAKTLVGGSVQVTVQGSALATATDTLTAAYTPDAGSSSVYNSASGTGSVTVTAPTLLTPTITVSPSPASITTAQSTTVTVTVSGGSGNPVPTGSITLTSGSYNSGAKTLVGGSVTVTVQGSALATATDTLMAAYTPDAGSSSTYNSATGTGSVTVTSATQTTPTVSVTPNPSSIGSAQSTMITVTVSGGGSNPTPTGSITLTSGSYNSGAQTLVGGSVTITVQGSALANGTDLVHAAYTPDSGSSSIYNSATGVTTVTVTGSLSITSFTASPNPIPAGSSSTQLTAVFAGGTGVITPGNISVTTNVPVTVSPTATTTYTLTVTPTSGSPITATVTVSIQSGVAVNPANLGIAVNDRILGMNMAAWYDELTNATSINNAFAANGIKAIRWPGGSWSDVYHWGYQSGSGTLVAPYQCTCSSATHCTANSTGWAGYGSFAQFANAIPKAGSYDLALTANYGTNEACTGGGDPNEAAAWIAAATTDGVSVSHMTVGNEEYGNWETDLHATANDPTTYANAVIGTGGYYSLIKAASSSTLVGVVVEPNYSPWDQTVMTTAKGSYDFVEYHYYPETPGSENDTTLIKNAAQALTTNINKIKTELTNWGTPNTPIYVGEIGGAYSNPGKQSWSITQGLYAGEVLGEMMNDGVSRLTWWISFGNCNGQSGNNGSSVYGWQTFGAYNVFSDGNQDSTCNYGGNAETTVGTPSPTAIAFDLFSNVAVNGEHVLSPAVTGDTSDVRAYAATHSGGTALVVFNLNETTAQTVQLTVTGESNSAGVTEYTYDKQMYDYTNTSCSTAPLCSYDSTHNYSNVDWVGPTTTSLGAQSLPMTVTLQPWSINVFIIQ